ncbi:MAG TPA: protease modulator HflC [Anaerohalosphaeraceae bacterium]|nr:protease modulator HflC [Phycisphaerae bacterium]HOL30561.1 protease modulator HflC [Anaerohalosphaeraceae bacterium]HOM75044.1 protease modulator HflC [Anaerohalosphaeraceae bacterium]HPC63618.1 protease modulator HflC [Anaerohalosphaeraceae bacterium]HPO68872.1 protease modulator HflC [Anaerohalosphaeraceae bacterium]
MKNFWIIVSMIVVVVILLLSMVLYQVRETETVIVTRFGKPVRPETEPGLKFRLPKPIEVVHRFDSRKRLFEDVPEEEITTAGGEPIIVKSYIIWRIADPGKFLISVKDVKSAEENLKSLLRNAQNSVIGRHYFSEFVNTDPEKIQFEQIESEIAGQILQKAMHDYGIEVSAVGIKRLMISKDVTEKVFERMKADRKRKTEAILAEGNAEAERIKSDADAKQKELLAVADAQAKAIRGAGDAEAARYYKMLEADPELAMFLRDIEALKKILKERSTIVLGVETEPIGLLKGLPDLQPQTAASQTGN